MESKRKRRRKTYKKSKVKLYSDLNSCGISLVLHSIIFIILALVCDRTQRHRPLAIELNFATTDIEIVDIAPIDINLDEIVPKISEITDQISDATDFTDAPVEISVELEDYKKSSTSSISVPDIDVLDEIIISNNNGIIKSGPVSVDNGSGFGSGFGSGSGNSTEMDRRLKAYGAKTGDIQISISWNNYNDIDLWLEYKDTTSKMGGVINWMNRSVGSGFLDVDMNYVPQTNQAVENIYWEKDEAPFGVYNVYIQNYHMWERGTNIDNTLIDVRIIVDGKIIHKKCSIKLIDGLVKIFTFVRKPTKEILARKNRKQQIKDNYGPGTFTPLGYTPDDIVIPPVPTFQ